MDGLSTTAIDTFQEQGYLIVRDIYDHETLQAVRNSISAQLDAECHRLIKQRLLTDTDALWNDPFETRFGNIIHRLDPMSDAQKQLLQAMQNLFLTGRFDHASIDSEKSGLRIENTLLRCIRYKRLLDVVKSLIGPDLIGSSTFRIRGKIPIWEPGRELPYFPGEVPWHQDAGYMLAHCDPHLIITCWIPLVNATINNGCMYVLPRKFEDGIITHHYGRDDRYIWINENNLPPGDPIPIEIEVGDVLLLHNMTPHASFDNNSGVTRWSMDLRYGSPTMPNNVNEDPESYTTERPSETMACAPTEADFVVSDSKNPQREIRDGKLFADLRFRYAKQHLHPGRGWTRRDPVSRLTT